MNRIVPLALIAACLLIGCSNIQRGRYGVSAEGHSPFSGVAGGLYWSYGHELTSRSEPTGKEIALLYVLIVCPSARGNISGSGEESGSKVTFLEFDYGVAPDDARVEVSWDRSADKVDIHGEQYGRGAGNFFVIVQDGGTTSSWQIKGLGVGASAGELLEHARAELPDVVELVGLEF